MNTALFSLSLEPSDGTAPTLPNDEGSQALPFARVSREQMSVMSDSELQDYIHGCAERFVAAQERWEATGYWGHVRQRDEWWGAEAEALREMGGRASVTRPGQLLVLARRKTQGANA